MRDAALRRPGKSRLIQQAASALFEHCVRHRQRHQPQRSIAFPSAVNEVIGLLGAYLVFALLVALADIGFHKTLLWGFYSNLAYSCLHRIFNFCSLALMEIHRAALSTQSRPGEHCFQIRNDRYAPFHRCGVGV